MKTYREFKKQLDVALKKVAVEIEGIKDSSVEFQNEEFMCLGYRTLKCVNEEKYADEIKNILDVCESFGVTILSVVEDKKVYTVYFSNNYFRSFGVLSYQVLLLTENNFLYLQEDAGLVKLYDMSFKLNQSYVALEKKLKIFAADYTSETNKLTVREMASLLGEFETLQGLTTELIRFLYDTKEVDTTKYIEKMESDSLNFLAKRHC